MTKETFIYGLNACVVTYHNGQKLYEHDDLVKCFEDLEMFEQEPFMSKPCVTHQVCHEDKVKVLDKIRADVINIADGKQSIKVRSVLRIVDKYKAEREDGE